MKFDDKELAGQRLMAGFDGTGFNDDIKNLIRAFKIGGLILFSRNIETPDQIRRLCLSAQEYALSLGLPPLFIAVDQEGGSVARLKAPFFTHFHGNAHISSTEQAYEFARITAREIKSVHINMNLSPVMDVIPKGFDSIMKGRAFEGSCEKVGKLGACVIEQMQKQGIMACAKHFPGIGNTQKDSHFDCPVLDSELEAMEAQDLIPFVAAKESKVAAIMLSHIIYRKLDRKWPASLSPKIAKDLLRNKIGFQGIVMTDDLDMKAINHDIKTCIDQILKSEIDIALICHTGPDIEAAFMEIYNLMSNNKELRTRGEESVKRILKIKKQYLNYGE